MTTFVIFTIGIGVGYVLTRCLDVAREVIEIARSEEFWR